MAHVYGTVPGLKNFIRDQGESKLGDSNDEQYLLWLEDGARAIDEYAQRTDPGHPVSGFGPRLGTNRYDGPCSRTLRLRDDLLAITSVTVRDTPTGSTRTLTDETDFLKVPYDEAPYRELLIHTDSSASWGTGQRSNDIAGKWGYQDVRASLTTLAAAVSDTTSTTVSLTATTEAGQTLLVGSEQMYVRAVSGAGPYAATVDRGVNGTTAATHLIAAAVEVYRYPSRIVVTNYRLAFRSWKTRNAGADGTDGGGQMLAGPALESEQTILRKGLWGLRLPEVG